MISLRHWGQVVITHGVGLKNTLDGADVQEEDHSRINR
jgi:hypothetical protein